MGWACSERFVMCSPMRVLKTFVQSAERRSNLVAESGSRLNLARCRILPIVL